MEKKPFPHIMWLIQIAIFLITATGCTGQIGITPTQTLLPSETFTSIPTTDTPVAPTDTAIPPTDTAIPPTDTAIPPTDTRIPPTETNTPLPPTPTQGLPFVFVRIIPSAGSLSDQLALEVEKAGDMGFTPVVLFDATW